MVAPHSPEEQTLRTLRFACACASAIPVASDPWVAIAKQGKLADGTKELILNALHHQPRSITELSQLLDLSPPAVHRHITEMLASDLIREEPIPATARRSPTERHYRPAFPIVSARDRRAFEPVLEDLASLLAAVFRDHESELAATFAQTELAARGASFEAVLQYLYATATRLARAQLEATEDLPPWPVHTDGSHWVWWAEEPLEMEVE